MEVPHGLNAPGFELFSDPGTNAPDFADIGALQEPVSLSWGHLCQIAHPGQLGRVAARLSISGFGNVVGQLGQGLGRANADTGGDVQPLLDLGDLGLGLGGGIGQACEVQETLVD